MNRPYTSEFILNNNRKSIRLRNHDYSRPGYYFVTICTYGRQHYSGNIADNKMSLNHFGETVRQSWLEIPKHFGHVALDTFIIMPNHLHGIIQIHQRRDVAMQRPYNNYFSRISPKPKSLSAIIRSFKSIVTKTIRQKSPVASFAWQPRFHDHIIRNETSLKAIRQYIVNNPLKWDWDEYNTNNLP